MTAKQVLKKVKSYFVITVGLLLYTLAWSVFIIPSHFTGGGVTGASAIIQYCTGFDVSYSFIIINTILLLIALKVLGKGFGVKTIYAMVVTSVFLKFVPMFIEPSFIQAIAIDNGKLLCAIMGGALSGFGVALTFAEGGSSGGTDIIALMINKYRAISPGRIILYIDIVIIACSLLIPTDGGWGERFATLVYGYVVAGVFSVTLDLVSAGSKHSVQLFIFSKKYDLIADRITNELHRGVTVLEGEGWYSKTQGSILVVVARRHELKVLLSMIKDVDPQAFISVASVNGVYGQGFEQIKK